MMAEDQVENTSETINYGSFINKFRPETIKSLIFSDFAFETRVMVFSSLLHLDYENLFFDYFCITLTIEKYMFLSIFLKFWPDVHILLVNVLNVVVYGIKAKF